MMELLNVVFVADVSALEVHVERRRSRREFVFDQQTGWTDKT